MSDKQDNQSDTGFSEAFMFIVFGMLILDMVFGNYLNELNNICHFNHFEYIEKYGDSILAPKPPSGTKIMVSCVMPYMAPIFFFFVFIRLLLNNQILFIISFVITIFLYIYFK